MGRCAQYMLYAAVAIAATNPLTGFSQVAPRGDQPQRPGSGRLAGRVVAADDGRPVRRAHVAISGRPASEEKIIGPNAAHLSRNAETTADGSFVFVDMPPGSYQIRVEPQIGFVIPSRPRQVTLADGQSLQTTIRLARTGVITGRVVDESGEAATGVQVHAVHRSKLGHHESLSYLGRVAGTNDRGEYRLVNLAPGDYYLIAMYTPVQRKELVQRSGYADTYYPGSPSRDKARPVRVRGGRETGRVNFTLELRRLATVTVRAVNSSGDPVGPDAQLMLWKRHDVFISGSQNVSRQAGGMFVFHDVAPGEYRLLVDKNSERTEAAYLDVTVGEEDRLVNLRTNAGATVSGRVLIDGQPASLAPNAAPYAVSVAAGPAPRTYGYAYAQMQVAHLRGTDRFELRGLRGPTVLSANHARTATASIRHAGAEISGKVLEFVGTESLDDVIVELTTKVGAVDITVTGTSSPDDPEPVAVILFSEDSSLWRVGYLQYTRTIASRRSAGVEPQVIRFSRMPAGRYLIVAVPDSDALEVTAPGVLEALRPRATPVTLIADQPARVSLRVTAVAR